MHHHCLDEDWFADIWRRLTVVSALIDDLLLGSGRTLHNYTDFDNDNSNGINIGHDDFNVKDNENDINNAMAMEMTMTMN